VALVTALLYHEPPLDLALLSPVHLVSRLLRRYGETACFSPASNECEIEGSIQMATEVILWDQGFERHEKGAISAARFG